MSTSRKALACEGIEVVDTPGGCKVEKMNWTELTLCELRTFDFRLVRLNSGLCEDSVLGLRSCGQLAEFW